MTAKSATTKSKATPAKSAPKTSATKAAKPAKTAGATVTPVVRRKELVARIAKTSGAKPSAIKAVLDATLKELGDAIAAGEALSLPGLGRVTVNREKDGPKGKVIICRIRQKAPKPDVAETVAPAEGAA